MKFGIRHRGTYCLRPRSQRQLPDLAKSLGTKALLVLGRSGRGRRALIADLAQAGVRSVPFHVEGEPTVVMVDQAKDLAMDEECELLIAVGGGSVIDAGKAAAGMLNNPGAVLDYLVVGGGKPLRRPAMPWIAVPTTAGTGAEVTRNAVLDVPDRRVKVSLRSQYLLPAIAVIDPELTLSLPPAVTAFTGMDALTDLIEPFVSNAANPITDGVCREGLRLAARSLATAFHDGTNLAARTEMSAGGDSGRHRSGPTPSWARCTAWPASWAEQRAIPIGTSAAAAAAGHGSQHPRPQDHPAGSATLARYAEVKITADPSARPGDGVAWVNTLCVEFQIPHQSVRSHGAGVCGDRPRRPARQQHEGKPRLTSRCRTAAHLWNGRSDAAQSPNVKHLLRSGESGSAADRKPRARLTR